MAERKSVNKYYPPDWDPSKGSVNKYVGQHPLRDRAKKLGQGILVIRFELPYNIWCGGCNAHIGMGVRYNAEKSKTGMYYSTPIYKFRMKCHLCDNYFEIQTDPKNHDYVILEGARRKEQRWDPKENEQIVPEDKATQKKMATDAMFKLEHGSDDVKRGQKAISNLGSLELRRDEWKDDYMLNKMARQKFRDEKKSLKIAETADSDLLTKSSLEIPLVSEREEDVKIAGLMKYRTLESYDEKQAQKRQAIGDRPLFSDVKKSKLNDTGNDDAHKLDIIRQQIRRSKTAKAGGAPFDRMTMNAVSPSSTLTQSSLGIRRKSKDSVKSPTTHTNSSKCLDDSESSTTDEHPKMNSSACEVASELEDGASCVSDISTDRTLCNGDNNLGNKDKPGADESVIPETCNKPVTDSVTVDTHNGDTHKVQAAGVVLSANSSLSLVSSYSDSSTDSES